MMNEEYIKLTQEWHKKGFESRQPEVDELQKRIDEALYHLDFNDDNDKDIAISILKGQEND